MIVHNKLLIGLILTTAAVYVIMVTFNALGGIGYQGLFNQSVGAVSDKYQVYITPAGWTFSIWSVIYILLGAGAVYSVSTLFRKGAANEPVYLNPTILNWGFYSALLLNYTLNTAWIFIWDDELLLGAVIVLLFIAYSGWLAFAVACYRAQKALTEKQATASHESIAKEVRWQTVIIQNGIAVYATWTTIASLLNLNIALQYVGGYNAELISIVCVSILLAILIGWFCLENSLFDRYVRYTLTQYPVVMFAVGGILSKQSAAQRPDGPVPESVSVLTWITFALATFLFVFRLVIVTWRYCSQKQRSTPEKD